MADSANPCFLVVSYTESNTYLRLVLESLLMDEILNLRSLAHHVGPLLLDRRACFSFDCPLNIFAMLSAFLESFPIELHLFPLLM